MARTSYSTTVFMLWMLRSPRRLLGVALCVCAPPLAMLFLARAPIRAFVTVLMMSTGVGWPLAAGWSAASWLHRDFLAHSNESHKHGAFRLISAVAACGIAFV